MIFFGILTLTWWLNSTLDNQGGPIHRILLWAFRASPLFVILQFYFAYTAANSYGTSKQVAASWFGAEIICTTATAASGSVAAVPSICSMGTATTGWVNSDLKYLMYRD